MARTLAVTSTAKAVFPNSANSEPVPQTIYNTGTVIVYLDEDQAVQPYSGVPLRPGSTIQWDADRCAYAVTDPGNIGALTVLDNQGYLFDAGAIATQILGQGLAADIATHIAISGAPPIDINALLLSQNVAILAADIRFPTASPFDLDMTRYQSVLITVEETPTASHTEPVAREIQVWWTDAAGVLLDSGSFWVSDNNLSPAGFFASYQTAVKGARMYLVAKANALNTGPVLAVNVTGSYKPVAKSRTVIRSQRWLSSAALGARGSALDNFVSASVPVTPLLVTYGYPPSKSGPATFSVRFTDVLTAGVLRVEVRDLAVDATLATAAAVIGSQVDTVSTFIHIPNRPLKLAIISSSTMTPVSTSVVASLVYSD